MEFRRPYPLVYGALLIGLATACSKSDDSATPVPTPAPTNASTIGFSHAPIWIGNSSTQITYQVAGTVELRQAQNTYSGPPSWRYRSYFYDNGADENVCEVSLGKMTFAGSAPTNAEMLAYFATGSRSFGGNGVIMSRGGWSEIHSTDLGQGQPTSSSFNITDVQPYDDGSGIYKLKVRATFKVRLFGTGTSYEDINDGVAVLIFANQ